jgi:hypothetical protein
VDGYLRLYANDVNELKRGLPVTCNSALIDQHIIINGVVREELFQKFLVFDDELLIGQSVEKGESAYNYPADISFYHEDLHGMCSRIGIQSDADDNLSANSQSVSLLQDSQPLDPSEKGHDELSLIGALACMLAMNNDLDGSLRDGQHISEIIIDDLFEMLSGIGFDVDGKQKFQYEKLITDGVKTILDK